MRYELHMHTQILKKTKRRNNSTIRFAVVYVRMLHLMEVSYVCVWTLA